jgi:hypothetical protein
MLLTTDYVDPATLTGYARAALQDIPANQPSLARWLPYRLVDDLVFRFVKGGDGLTEAATFRSWDTESPIGTRPGVTRVTGELAPISRKLRQSEYERLRGTVNGSSALATAIENDAARLARAINMRLELARGQALVSGAISINENGIVATADFGRAGGNTTAPTTLWTDLAASVPLQDLSAWCDAYEDINGVRPGAIVTSNRVRGLVLANAGVRALAGTVLGTPADVTMNQLAGQLAARDLPPLYTYNVKYSVAGSATRVIADDKVLLLPAPVDPTDEAGTELGATLMGTTLEAREPGYGIAEGDMPGLVAGTYSTQDPIALWTKVAGIAFPVLANANLSFVADVA